MKKLVVLVMVITLVFAVSCSKKAGEKAAGAGGLTSLLPENTELLLKFSSWETVRKQTSTSDATMFGRPIKRLAEIKQSLGFNPFNLDEFKAQGFDPGKEFGLAIADVTVTEKNNPPNFNGLLLFPVTDGKKAVETIKAAIQKNAPTTKVTQDGNLTVMQDGTSPAKVYLTVKDAYLLAAANPQGDAKAFLEAVLAGKTSLTKVKTYTDVTGKLPAGKEFLAYVNLARLAEQNLNALKNLSKQSAGAKGAPDLSASLNYLADCEGAGLTLDLASPNLTAKSVVNVKAGSKALKTWEGLQANKNAVLGIPEPPVLLLSALLNASEYYKTVVGALPENEAKNLKARLDGVKAMFGIDLENEVINNLAGNLNFGMYDGGSITMTNYNTLLTVSVKDEGVLKNALEKVFAKLPPGQKGKITKQKVGDVDAYVAMAGPVQLYLGVKGKNFIVAAGKPMFEKALKGDVSAGFIAALKDKDLAETFKRDGSLLYFNVAEALKVVKNFQMLLMGFTQGKGLDQKTQDALGKFEFVVASSKLEGTSIVGDFLIKTSFTEPFFVAVEKLSKSVTP